MKTTTVENARGQIYRVVFEDDTTGVVKSVCVWVRNKHKSGYWRALFIPSSRTMSERVKRAVKQARMRV